MLDPFLDPLVHAGDLAAAHAQDEVVDAHQPEQPGLRAQRDQHAAQCQAHAGGHRHQAGVAQRGQRQRRHRGDDEAAHQQRCHQPEQRQQRGQQRGRVQRVHPAQADVAHHRHLHRDELAQQRQRLAAPVAPDDVVPAHEDMFGAHRRIVRRGGGGSRSRPPVHRPAVEELADALARAGGDAAAARLRALALLAEQAVIVAGPAWVEAAEIVDAAPTHRRGGREAGGQGTGGRGSHGMHRTVVAAGSSRDRCMMRRRLRP